MMPMFVVSLHKYNILPDLWFCRACLPKGYRFDFYYFVSDKLYCDLHINSCNFNLFELTWVDGINWWVFIAMYIIQSLVEEMLSRSRCLVF